MDLASGISDTFVLSIQRGNYIPVRPKLSEISIIFISMQLNENETEVVGHWFMQNGRMMADESAKRIEHLINHDLKKIGTDASGWIVLYLDRNDNRYWVMTYPHGEMQGGGPPMLQNISLGEAKIKYGITIQNP